MNKEPRKIDPKKTFNALVDRLYEQCLADKVPGVIIGISGTDSIVTFLAYAKVFERLGKPERVIGINYEHIVDKGIKEDFGWVSKQIFPWLKQQAPKAQYIVDRTISRDSDNQRWANMFDRSIAEADPRATSTHDHYYTVSTRNATEHALGSYTRISMGASLFPLTYLYKSEILEICKELNVPSLAVKKSGEVDCACGRFEVQADYIQELDWVIMASKGELEKGFLDKRLDREIRARVTEFYMEEQARNDHKISQKTKTLPTSPVILKR